MRRKRGFTGPGQTVFFLSLFLLSRPFRKTRTFFVVPAIREQRPENTLVVQPFFCSHTHFSLNGSRHPWHELGEIR